MFAASWKVMLQFEVPDETIEIDGKPTPMVIGKEYTLSLNEKATLRHDLQSWRGREFTPKELEGFAVEAVVGAPAMITILHKTSAKKKVYAAITAIAKPPKGLQCPPQFHKTVKYEITQGADEVYNALPEWIRKKIAACGEWAEPSGKQPEEPADKLDRADEQADAEVDNVPF